MLVTMFLAQVVTGCQDFGADPHESGTGHHVFGAGPHESGTGDHDFGAGCHDFGAGGRKSGAGHHVFGAGAEKRLLPAPHQKRKKLITNHLPQNTGAGP